MSCGGGGAWNLQSSILSLIGPSQEKLEKIHTSFKQSQNRYTYCSLLFLGSLYRTPKLAFRYN
jgi:hypothetical protein